MAKFVVCFLFAFLRTTSAQQPEQVHLSFADDPQAMTVQWVTFQPMQSPLVMFGTDPNKLEQSAQATVDLFQFENIVRFIYTATMSNLQPKSRYYYRVGDSHSHTFSRTFHFRTLPSGTDFSYKVLIMGDLGVEGGHSLPYLIEEARNETFDFMIHVGDIAYDLHTDQGKVGDKYMRDLEPVVAYVPYLVIAGNHEDDKKNFSHYKHRFRMPNSPGGDNQFYSINVGPVHFIGLSTEFYGFFYEYGQDSVFTQMNWLVNDLKKATTNRESVPWIVSFQHRPFYCSNTNSYECQSFENSLIRNGFEEMPGLEGVFTEYGMDLAFWGHEHSYERFYPIDNRVSFNSSADSEDAYSNAVAPTYLITGSAGCHSPHAPFADQPSAHSAFRSTDFGYTFMHVLNRTHLFLEQISVEDERRVIDHFWLTKSPGTHPARHRAKRRAGTPFPAVSDPTECNMKDPRCRANRRAALARRIRG